VSACGNAVIDPGEGCDDGQNVETGTCPHCVKAFCGDGYVQAGVEQCDPGASNWSGKCDALCKRTIYQACMTIDDCPSGNNCAQWAAATTGFNTCAPTCTSDASCPSAPPYASACNLAYCALLCNNRTCPFGMVCAPGVTFLNSSGTMTGTRDVCIVQN
jgi:hypothetical protein